MLRNFVVGFGTVGAVLLTAGCLGFYDDEAPPQRQIAEPEAFDQPAMQEQRAYRPIPRPKPRPAMTANPAQKMASAGKEAGAKKLAKTDATSGETTTKPVSDLVGTQKPSDAKSSVPKAAEAGPAVGSKAPVSKTPVAGPVTPAEIRTAVPVQKLDNPKLALSGVQVKSVWGGVLGRVTSLDVSAGRLKTLDISVAASPGAKPKIVRLEPSRLKYMPNRKMVLTTLSKPDLEKLPASANP